MSSDYSSLKVVDLKRKLKTRGLSTAGNKDELVERLNTYTQNLLGSGSDIDAFGESIVENDILYEDVLGGELDYEDDMLKKSSELEFSSVNENNPLHLAGDISIDSNNSSLNVTVIAANDEKPLPQRETRRNQQKGEKKVHLIRNRSLSLLSDSDLKENDKLEGITDQCKGEKTDDQPSTAKICTKGNVRSAEERLELRKRKFGVVDEDDKKSARAARFGITDATRSKSSAKKFLSNNKSNEMHESIDVLKQRAQRFGLAVAPALEKTKTLDALKSRAERFGAVVSPLLNKLSEEEKMQARRNRFLSSSASDPSAEEKKKLRAARFNVTT